MSERPHTADPRCCAKGLRSSLASGPRVHVRQREREKEARGGASIESPSLIPHSRRAGGQVPKNGHVFPPTASPMYDSRGLASCTASHGPHSARQACSPGPAVSVLPALQKRHPRTNATPPGRRCHSRQSSPQSHGAGGLGQRRALPRTIRRRGPLATRREPILRDLIACSC